MSAPGKIGIKAISAVIGIPLGIATKKAVRRIWLAARPDDPPRKPTEAGVRWGDAIGWAALSAAGIVISELITQIAAQEAYRLMTGNEPPAPKPRKDTKKLEKATGPSDDKKDRDKKAEKKARKKAKA